MNDSTALLIAALSAEREAWLRVRGWPPGSENHDATLWADWLMKAECLALFPLPARPEFDPRNTIRAHEESSKASGQGAASAYARLASQLEQRAPLLPEGSRGARP